jgi:uncharacterized protein (DUF1810 family)
VNGYDPHDLSRFEQAQANQHQMTLSEIRGGHKRSHWMWFIFPQFDVHPDPAGTRLLTRR